MQVLCSFLARSLGPFFLVLVKASVSGSSHHVNLYEAMALWALFSLVVLLLNKAVSGEIIFKDLMGAIGAHSLCRR